MARIDFAFGAPDRLKTACVIARKRFTEGQRLIVFCTDARRLAAFDRLLWTFDPASFIPHVSADDPLCAQTPIVLCTSSPFAVLAHWPAAPTPWLLNLDDDCAPALDRFERVMEVVSHSEDERQAARSRWRTYTAAGHDVHAHDLSKSKPEASE